MTETIPANLVKQLRDLTGAGMMDCKRALQETDGDLQAARTLLRERGMASAGKRAGRATTEGVVRVGIENGVGTMVAVGCETEPVSKTAEFQAFADHVLKNVVVVGAVRFEADEDQVLAAYVHPPANKIGVLVQLDGGTEELARQLAMHGSFAAPEWTTREDVPPELLAAERQIYVNSDEVQSKPEAAREKIDEGMLAKRFYAASPGGVLVDQAWIHDSAKTVGQVLADAGATVKVFARVSVAGS